MATERLLASIDQSNHVREASQTLDTVNSESARTVAEKNAADLDMDQLYFAELSKLVSIGQKMMSRDYNTIKVQQAPSIEALWTISDLLNEIDTWSTTLPDKLDPRGPATPSKSKITRQRLSLGLHYHSTRITLTHATLGLQVPEPADQNDQREVCRPEYLAAECVNSACHIIRVLAQASEKKIALHDISSWWFVLHFLMQATAVLCREICDGFRHAPERASVHKQAARISVELLSNLSKSCESSKRALKLVKPLVEHLLSNDGKVENKMEEDEETDGDAVGQAVGEAVGGVKGVPGAEEVGEEVDNVEPNHFQGIMEGLPAPDSYPTSHFQTDVLRIIQSIPVDMRRQCQPDVLRTTQPFPVDMPPQFVDPSQVSLGGGSLTEGGFPYPSSCTDNLPLPFSDNEPRFPGQYGSGYYYPI